MKVLFVTGSLPTEHELSGARMAPLARQIESLRKLGIDADVVEVNGLPKLKYLGAIASVRRRAKNADLIHAHYGFCGWVGRMQRSVPLIVSLMGSDVLGRTGRNGSTPWSSRIEAWMTRKLAHVADSVIVKSEEMADKVRCPNAYVIPNGIDIELFRPIPRDTARAALSWSPKTAYIMFPGNPEQPRKGYPLALEAVNRLRENLDFDIELVALWAIPPAQVPLYLNAADALIMTSYSEGSPNAVKEAMACNLPVVSVRVGDVAWLLRGVHPGAVCERNSEELAAALAPIVGSRERSNGRDTIMRLRLDSASVARRIETVYSEVLNR